MNLPVVSYSNKLEYCYALFGEIGFLGELSLGRSTPLRVLDADNEAALVLDTEIVLHLAKF